MDLQLKVNNSGSWKTICHDLYPNGIEAAKAAVLKLLACDRSPRAVWKIDRESTVHPGGETLWTTRGSSGKTAVWVEGKGSK